jgi:predicted nucleic acid-binding protein
VPFVVIYDANVLYPSGLRDLLLEMPSAGEFRAHYTAEILDEVFENLQTQLPDADPEKLEVLRSKIENAVPDALVTAYDSLIPSLALPDPDDRHVLAAAIRAGAQVIVTDNKKDFPADALAPYDIEAQNADTFVHSVGALYPQIVVQALQRISDRLDNPPRTPRQILERLEDKAGLVQTAALILPLLP